MASRSDRFKEIAEKAREKTNAELDAEIAELIELSEADINRIVSKKGDKAKLAQLMAIVSESTAENIRTANLIRNIGDLGEIVVRVLKKTLV